MSPRVASLLALAGCLLQAAPGRAAPPRLGPSGASGRLDRDGRGARVRNLHGVLRLRFEGARALRDENGPYLMVRYQATNARSRTAEIHRENLLLRTPDGSYQTPEGIADHPPLGYLTGADGRLVRPHRAWAGPVRVLRDRPLEVYASFRGTHDPETVDPLARFDGEPYFLRRPLRAPLDDLAGDALAFAAEQRMDMARGLLREAAGGSSTNGLILGAALLRAAYRFRRADQPVSEDRVLRLALPYAPNPAYAQARLAELRRRLGHQGRRQGKYHRRRASRYQVSEDR